MPKLRKLRDWYPFSAINNFKKRYAGLFKDDAGDYYIGDGITPPKKITNDGVLTITGNIVDNTDPQNPTVDQVQSDWNQSNNALPDFIKNKPVISSSIISVDGDFPGSPYTPGSAVNTWFRIDSTGGVVDIHGSASPVDQETILISNLGSSSNDVIFTPLNIHILDGNSAEFIYDSTLGSYVLIFQATLGSAPTYPDTRIPFGNGSTPGGITSSAFTFASETLQILAAVGTSSGWGNIQSIITSAGSEAGFSLNNIGTGGRQYNIISTSNASGIGGGNFSIGDATTSANRFMIDGSGAITIFDLAGNGSGFVAVDNNGLLSFGIPSGSIPALNQFHLYVGDISNAPIDAGTGLTYDSSTNFDLTLGTALSTDTGNFEIGGSAEHGLIFNQTNLDLRAGTGIGAGSVLALRLGQADLTWNPASGNQTASWVVGDIGSGESGFYTNSTNATSDTFGFNADTLKGFSYAYNGVNTFWPKTYTDPGDNGKVPVLNSATGVVSWGFSGGITYGGLVDAGHPNEVLYIDPTGNLTSDTFFVRDNSSFFSTLIKSVNGPNSSLISIDSANGIEVGYFDASTTTVTQYNPGDSEWYVTNFGNFNGIQINKQSTNFRSGLHLGLSGGGTLFRITNNSIDWDWPTADGLANQALITDASGILSFGYPAINVDNVTITGDGTAGSPLIAVGSGAPALIFKQVAYGDSGNLMTSDSGMTRDPTNFNQTLITSINGSAQGALTIDSIASQMIQTDAGGTITSGLIVQGGQYTAASCANSTGALSSNTFWHPADMLSQVTDNLVSYSSELSLTATKAEMKFRDITNTLTSTFGLESGTGVLTVADGTNTTTASVFPTQFTALVNGTNLLQVANGTAQITVAVGSNSINELFDGSTGWSNTYTQSGGILQSIAFSPVEAALENTDNVNYDAKISLQIGSFISSYKDIIANVTNSIGFLGTSGLSITNNNGTTDTIWKWMLADGTLGQAVITDGAGNLSFASVSTSASFFESFLTTDWVLNGQNYELTVNHSLNSIAIDVTTFESNNIVMVDEITIIDSNNIKLLVPVLPDLRFSGNIEIQT